nr:MAG TPA: hypothetical protein [Caudoviricetes sp.]
MSFRYLRTGRLVVSSCHNYHEIVDFPQNRGE